MLVLFDIDNTLVYSNGLDSQSFASAFMDAFGGSPPSLNWHDYAHVTDYTIVQEIFQQQFGRGAEDHEIEVLLDNYLARMRAARMERAHDYASVPYAVETVAKLKEMGFHVGIASGGFRRPQEIKLEHVGISLDGLPAGYADGHETREQIVRQALAEAAGLNYERVVYVGDAAWDVRTTRNLGIPFVGIRRRGDVETLHAEGAKHVLVDFKDFDAFLKALHEAVPPAAAFSKTPASEEDND